MRFELGLNGLPQITADEVSVKLAGLPKGVITGVIVKSLQERRLPTVPVAWSEDKRAINEIEDRLTELGAECYVVDHAFFPRRIATMIAERIAGDRYRKVEKEDRSLIKMGDMEKKSLSGNAMHHVLMYVLHACVVGALFVWHVANGVGLVAMMSTNWLISELGACAVGVLAAYVLTVSVDAVRQGNLKIRSAAPFVMFSVGCTLAALFFIKQQSDEESARQAIVHPPSNPYGGLLVELRRRQGERGPLETVTRAEFDETAATEMETGDLMCMDGSDGLSQCLGGPSWELALACLPKPKPPARTVASVTVAPRQPVKPVRAAKRRVVWRPWGVRLELLHLSSIVLVWMLSLVGLYFVLARRAKLSKEPLEGVEEGAGGPAQGAHAPAELELEALRAELAAARVQASMMQGAEDPQVVQALRRELSDTQGALEVQRNGVLQLREYATRAKELLGTQAAEILALKQRLGQLAAAPAQQASRHIAAHAPAAANQQGTPSRQDPAARSPSSYSGEGVQEERVSIPKRRT